MKSVIVVVMRVVFAVALAWAFVYPVIYSPTGNVVPSAPVKTDTPVSTPPTPTPVDSTIPEPVSTPTSTLIPASPLKPITLAPKCKAKKSFKQPVCEDRKPTAAIHPTNTTEPANVDWAIDNCTAYFGLNLLWSKYLDSSINKFDMAVLASEGLHCATMNYLQFTGGNKSSTFMNLWGKANEWAGYARNGWRVWNLPGQVWNQAARVGSGIYNVVKDVVLALYRAPSNIKALYYEWKEIAAPFADRLYDCENPVAQLIANMFFFFFGNGGVRSAHIPMRAAMAFA